MLKSKTGLRYGRIAADNIFSYFGGASKLAPLQTYSFPNFTLQLTSDVPMALNYGNCLSNQSVYCRSLVQYSPLPALSAQWENWKSRGEAAQFPPD